VRLSTAGHPVRVLGDAAASEVAVDGPHSLRREGDVVMIETEPHDGATFVLAMGQGRGRRERPWRWAPPLTVRMPPSLALHADVAASSLVVHDVTGPITLG